MVIQKSLQAIMDASATPETSRAKINQFWKFYLSNTQFIYYIFVIFVYYITETHIDWDSQFVHLQAFFTFPCTDKKCIQILSGVAFQNTHLASYERATHGNLVAPSNQVLDNNLEGLFIN